MVAHPSQLQGDSLSVWKLPTLQPEAGFTRGSYYSLPQPSRLVWTAGGDEVTLPLPQPHSKGITFTENTFKSVHMLQLPPSQELGLLNTVLPRARALLLSHFAA